MSDTYELRCTSYMVLRCGSPALHTWPALELALRELRQLEAYSPGWIDCELREWDDRANAEDCWRDWWKAEWVEPELDDEDGGAPPVSTEPRPAVPIDATEPAGHS